MDDYEMDDEELNEIMKYEYERIINSDILNLGFEVKLENDSENEQKDYTKWNLIMKAPDDSDYKDGYYSLDIKFVKNYPYKNPIIKFKNQIYHCNVKDNGDLNVNWILPGMKIDYIMPRLLTLFYLQDTSVEPNNPKCILYNEEKEENKNTKKDEKKVGKFIKNVRENVGKHANTKLSFK